MTPAAWAREVAGYRHLLANCIRRELALKYRHSVLGIAWSFLKPLALTGLYVFATRHVLGIGDERAVAQIAIGVCAWGFFSGTLLDALRLLRQHRALLRQVAFPRELLVLGRVAVQAVELALSLALFQALLALTGHGDAWIDPLLLMPALAAAVLLALAIALVVAPIGARFDDSVHLADVLLGALFWLTPVVYATARVPEPWRAWVDANPLSPVIGLLRSALIAGEPAPAVAPWLLAGLFAAVAAVALPLFRRATHDVAEIV
ncbi:MAG TPA: ABC transporter permease [Planctomycetota bacterium]|nr:ABC transporter permease [Planctomycetota bacterium]